MVTQAKKLVKTEAWSLKGHNHSETVTKCMIFPFIEIPGKAGAGMHPST